MSQLLQLPDDLSSKIASHFDTNNMHREVGVFWSYYPINWILPNELRTYLDFILWPWLLVVAPINWPCWFAWKILTMPVEIPLGVTAYVWALWLSWINIPYHILLTLIEFIWLNPLFSLPTFLVVNVSVLIAVVILLLFLAMPDLFTA